MEPVPMAQISGGTTTAYGGYQNNYMSWAVQSSPVLGSSEQYDSPKGYKEQQGISPILYFKYIKSKFKLLERGKMERRLKEIERAFDAAMENGQEMLAAKFLVSLTRESKEAIMLAKGIKYYITRESLGKHKYNLTKGHISDTPYEQYTRHIPSDIIKKKKALQDVFNGFVIYHYWNETQADVEEMEPDEKAKMRDPVLLGYTLESDRLYFIGDWQDEFCDLTFDKLIGVIGKQSKKQISNKPVLDTDI